MQKDTYYLLGIGALLFFLGKKDSVGASSQRNWRPLSAWKGRRSAKRRKTTSLPTKEKPSQEEYSHEEYVAMLHERYAADIEEARYVFDTAISSGLDVFDAQQEAIDFFKEKTGSNAQPIFKEMRRWEPNDSATMAEANEVAMRDARAVFDLAIKDGDSVADAQQQAIEVVKASPGIQGQQDLFQQIRKWTPSKSIND